MAVRTDTLSIFSTPGRYIQGAGAIYSVGELLRPFGKTVLVVGGKTALSVTNSGRAESFMEHGMRQFEMVSPSLASGAEISEIVTTAQRVGCDVIMACGGGKVVDAVKAAGEVSALPVVIVPTIASNDAPCSALSVLYNDDGTFSKLLPLVKNPELVIVDTEIIARAPADQLVAGMGDALATLFEAEACMRTGALNILGGKPGLMAIAAARLCYETLMDYGREAKRSCEAGMVSHALEKVVEANVLLSGVGFESGGVAAAHAFAEALSVLHGKSNARHGEAVAFGLLVHLMLDNHQAEEIGRIYGFCRDVGLPITLKQLGLDRDDEETLRRIAKIAAEPSRPSHNLRRGITGSEIYDAIIKANDIGNMQLMLST